jgi:hypothetical protein
MHTSLCMMRKRLRCVERVIELRSGQGNFSVLLYDAPYIWWISQHQGDVPCVSQIHIYIKVKVKLFLYLINYIIITMSWRLVGVWGISSRLLSSGLDGGEFDQLHVPAALPPVVGWCVQTVYSKLILNWNIQGGGRRRIVYFSLYKHVHIKITRWIPCFSFGSHAPILFKPEMKNIWDIVGFYRHPLVGPAITSEWFKHPH